MAGGRFKRVARHPEDAGKIASAASMTQQDAQSEPETPIKASDSQKQGNGPENDTTGRSGAIRKMALLIGTAVQLQNEYDLAPHEIVADIRKPEIAQAALEEYSAFILQVQAGLVKRLGQAKEGEN